MKRQFLIVSTFSVLLGACASVPRDGGLADISRSVNQRTNQTVEFQQSANAADDPRVAGMLEGELDADEAVAIAMMNNPRLQVILAEQGIAHADLIEASTISNPVLELETRLPGRPFRPYEITLAQSLIDLIQLPRRRRMGSALFETAKLRVSAEVLRFSAEVRDDYYSLLAASQNLAASRTAADAARTSTELAARQHAAGNITDLDLENEQAVYEDSKLDLAQAEEHLMVRREQLIQSLGVRDPGVNLSLRSDFPELPSTEMSEEEISSLAQQRRLDVAIARREVEIAQQGVPLSRLSALGDVVGDAHLEREPDGTRTTGPGIEFPIPIFNSGRAARTRAEARLIRSQQALAVLTARAGSETRVVRQRLATARARVEYYRDVVLPRRSRITELTKLQQNAMIAGIYQLLQARQNEANARREYIQAQLDYWSARNNLERALNGTSSTDLDMTMGSDERRTGSN